MSLQGFLTFITKLTMWIIACVSWQWKVSSCSIKVLLFKDGDTTTFSPLILPPRNLSCNFLFQGQSMQMCHISKFCPQWLSTLEVTIWKNSFKKCSIKPGNSATVDLASYPLNSWWCWCGSECSWMTIGKRLEKMLSVSPPLYCRIYQIFFLKGYEVKLSSQ